MITRDELIWRMAESAWGHHYCPTGAKGEQCASCREDPEQKGCFELGSGFVRKDSWEWHASAKGALERLEKELGIDILEWGEK